MPTYERPPSQTTPIVGGQLTPPRPPNQEVMTQVEALKTSVGFLEVSLGELNTTLSPVCIEQSPNIGSASKPYAIVDSPLGNSLQQIVQRVDDMLAYVHDMHRRTRI